MQSDKGRACEIKPANWQPKRDNDKMGISKEIPFDAQRNNTFMKWPIFFSKYIYPKTLSAWGYKKLSLSEDGCILVQPNLVGKGAQINIWLVLCSKKKVIVAILILCEGDIHFHNLLGSFSRQKSQASTFLFHPFLWNFGLCLNDSTFRGLSSGSTVLS